MVRPSLDDITQVNSLDLLHLKACNLKGHSCLPNNQIGMHMCIVNFSSVRPSADVLAMLRSRLCNYQSVILDGLTIMAMISLALSSSSVRATWKPSYIDGLQHDEKPTGYQSRQGDADDILSLTSVRITKKSRN